MADPAGVGINFLNLAYLIEIAVVLNLTYRELKFPGLYDELKKRIEGMHENCKDIEAESDADTEKVFPEIIYLRRLLLYKVPSQEKSFSIYKDPWDGYWMRKFFFKFFIKKRYSLSVVNFSILISVAILVFCTLFSFLSFNVLLEGVFSSLDAATITLIAQVCWYVIFIVSVGLCVIPLFFIRLGTLCERLFYGSDGVSGVTKEIKAAIDDRIENMKTKNQSVNDDAATLKLPDV